MNHQAESMKKQIEAFIDDLKSNKKISSFDEASTRQAIVLRLLSYLGWDIFNVDDVYPDYTANSVSVSYALRVKESNKVFIEVKRVNEKLDNHQKEFVDFSSREEVDLAVLTNGINWWFYLISAMGTWQQKWFYSIDFFKQKPDVFISHLIALLTNAKVVKGQFIKTAGALYQSKRKKMAAEFLPEAWNQIISQPSKIFVELLSENTEKLCGFKVDSKAIEKFLEKHLDNWLLKSTPSSAVFSPATVMETELMDLDLDEEVISESDEPSPVPASHKPESYADRTIKSFAFNGHTYPVRQWEEVLTTLCDHFATVRAKDFEKVLWISNDQKPYFSRYSDQLRIPEKIKHTDIYVETKLKPDEIVKAAGKLLMEFGHSKEELVINTQ
jgi:predicted type IV restriction endonuclease